MHDFAVANAFVIGNSIFGERDSHLISYQCGNAKTLIDFVVLRKPNLKMAKNIKVIPSEECVPQCKLLTCKLRLKTPKSHPKPFSPLNFVIGSCRKKLHKKSLIRYSCQG